MVACTFLCQAWQHDQLSGMAENGSLLPLLLFFLSKSSACHRGLPFPGPCSCFIFVYNCQYACTDNGTWCSYLKSRLGSFLPGMPQSSPCSQLTPPRIYIRHPTVLLDSAQGYLLHEVRGGKSSISDRIKLIVTITLWIQGYMQDNGHPYSMHFGSSSGIFSKSSEK